MTAGCVIIGRNEAARLPAALASVAGAGIPMVYVDSGSHDTSVAVARTAQAQVVELDPGRPFTAARARNEGFDALLGTHPDLNYVMFLDGDCQLAVGFVAAAVAVMDVDPSCAIIVGHLTEANPDTSIYARMCSVEWAAHTGKITDFNSFGGIMLVRTNDFRRVGGFNPTMIAGEDPEFAVRLSLAGRDAIRIDAHMATHRADIVRFRQWWQRAVRGGHALAHRYRLHGTSRLQDCRRQYWSTIFWGGALPVAAIMLLPFTRGLSLLLLAGYALLSARMTAHYRSGGTAPILALKLAGFGILAKFANFIGVLRFVRHHMLGKTELVEYK